MTHDQLKEFVNQTITSLSSKLPPRSTIILMVGIPEGDHDAYFTNYAGPCLSAEGLLERGYGKVKNDLIKYKIEL